MIPFAMCRISIPLFDLVSGDGSKDDISCKQFCAVTIKANGRVWLSALSAERQNSQSSAPNGAMSFSQYLSSILS